MASVLDQIKAPIHQEMSEFEDRFRAEMKSSVPLLDRITHYIIKRKGKQLRPMLVFLSAKLCGGITESTFHAAALIELLHTATLVHDDVVDDAGKRRGYFALNALWKNKVAVLVGDYLLSRGLLLSVANEEFRLLEIVSHAVKEMSEGELLQIEQSRRLNITEDTYYKIITKKTASLIASCCCCGASSAKAGEDKEKLLNEFGKMIGIAFQIKDDIFDYGDGAKLGKPTGIDIKERKITLPLIYTLNHVEKPEQKKIRSILRNHNHKREKIKEVIGMVEQSHGIQYAIEQMMAYKDRSLKILQSFEQNEARASLELLVNYTVERKY